MNIEWQSDTESGYYRLVNTATGQIIGRICHEKGVGYCYLDMCRPSGSSYQPYGGVLAPTKYFISADFAKADAVGNLK